MTACLRFLSFINRTLRLCTTTIEWITLSIYLRGVVHSQFSIQFSLVLRMSLVLCRTASFSSYGDANDGIVTMMGLVRTTMECAGNRCPVLLILSLETLQHLLLPLYVIVMTDATN